MWHLLLLLLGILSCPLLSFLANRLQRCFAVSNVFRKRCLAEATGSHQQQQQSKLEIKIGFLVGFQKGRFGPRPGNLLLRLISRHFRNEIKWCFAVSDVFRKRCLVVGFLL